MTAGPDYELAYALLADERETLPETPGHVRNALLELAYRTLGFSWPTGRQTRSFLGTTPKPLGPGDWDEVNGILAKAGIPPLVPKAVDIPNPWESIQDVMDAFWGAGR